MSERRDFVGEAGFCRRGGILSERRDCVNNNNNKKNYFMSIVYNKNTQRLIKIDNKKKVIDNIVKIKPQGINIKIQKMYGCMVNVFCM